MKASSSSVQTISVVLRSSLAAHVGRPTVRVHLPAEATVEDVRAAVAADYPDVAPLIERALVVAGDRVLSRTDPLPPAADVALIPPVSGG